MTERFSTKGGRSFPERRGVPPAWPFFERERPPAGVAACTLAFDDLRIALHGLDEALSAGLCERFAAYLDRSGAAPDLDLAVAHDEAEYFIPLPASPEFNPVWIACEARRVRYSAYTLSGWFDGASARGGVVLARGTYEPPLRALENFLRCAVAWRAAERGGALVHGASAVRNGKGYLFFGASGAGKSTLAAVDRRARIVSDDLSLLLPSPAGRLDLVGTPFRGTYEEGDPVVGRFPLAAAFRIVKAAQAGVREVPRALVFGQLVANLTFVAEAFGERPDLFESVERAFSGVPLRHLDFRKDDSYWDAIDAAGL